MKKLDRAAYSATRTALLPAWVYVALGILWLVGFGGSLVLFKMALDNELHLLETDPLSVPDLEVVW